MKEADNQKVISAKDKVLQRLKDKNPDADLENEDSLYGLLGSEFDNVDNEIGKYKKADESFSKALEKNPEMYELFAEMANNKEVNPLIFLIEKFGDDFKEALDDPEVAQKVAAASKAHLEKVSKEKALEDEAKANLETSVAALEEAQKETGCSDEDATAAFEAFTAMMDDAVRDKVSKDTWSMFIKAVTHDKDVEEALNVGEVKGRNAKIGKLKLKSELPSEVPPQITSQNEPYKESGTKIDGALGRYGNDYKDAWR